MPAYLNACAFDHVAIKADARPAAAAFYRLTARPVRFRRLGLEIFI